ncbi:MAG: rhodanese-like domain-containing protein [Pseudomonadota bacterium]
MPAVKNITALELAQLLKQEGIHLVDVRTEAEVARGKIPRGEAIPLHLLPLRLHELDGAKPTVFYCQMGARSAQAAAFSIGQGFTDVYNLQGGITAWAHSGLPIT